MLDAAPCDVGVLVGRDDALTAGPVLVPFGGGEHDWTAIELGAWLAGALDAPLRLAGPRETDRDASRLLASASLATQRAFGVTAEPLLVEPGAGGARRRPPTMRRSSSSGSRTAGSAMGSARSAERSPRVRGRRCCSPAAAFAPAGSPRARA